MSYGAVFSFAPLTLWVRIPLRRGVLEITLCDKVCQWFSQPIKLTTMAWYSWNTIESSVKHHNPNPVFSLAAQPVVTLYNMLCIQLESYMYIIWFKWFKVSFTCQFYPNMANYIYNNKVISFSWRGLCGHDRMVVGFTTICAINAFHC